MQTRKRLLLIALVGIWFGMATQGTAAPRVLHVCEDLCVNAASCGQECWLTQWEFDQDYPSTTCGDEGFDCCGDGTCNAGPEGCSVCPDDCGYESCPAPECYTNADCDYPDEVCNASRECVDVSQVEDGPNTPECGGSCTNSSQCCGTDQCNGAQGSGKCGVPSRDYCPNAPPCYGYWNGQPYQNCTFTDTLQCGSPQTVDLYCDPGTNRCMFNEGFDCPRFSGGGGPNICG